MEEPFLCEAYVFGDVLDGVDPLDRVQVAFTLNLPPQEVPLEGTEDAVLDALRDRQFAELPRHTATPVELRQRVETERDRALDHLRSVHRQYWHGEWRNEHRGGGRYPEDHLFEATDGYLDLLDAVRRVGRGRGGGGP